MANLIQKVLYILSGTFTGILTTVIFLNRATVAHPLRYYILFIIIGTIVGWVREKSNEEEGRILHLVLGYVLMYPSAYIVSYVTTGVLWLLRGILRFIL